MRQIARVPIRAATLFDVPSINLPISHSRASNDRQVCMKAYIRVLRFGLTTTAVIAAAGCASNRDSEHAVIPPDAKIEEIKGAAPNAAVHVAAADLAIGQGNVKEGIAQYNKALELDPKNRQALYKLATVQTLTKQFDKAIPTWQNYVEATDNSASALSDLGRCYELVGNWKQAEVSYLAALKSDPASKAARVNYGILLAKRDRPDEAEQQLGKVLLPAEVQYDLASVCEMRKDYAGAKQRYERALSFDPSLMAARQRLGMLHDEMSSAAN